jgi:hypothetical protein
MLNMIILLQIQAQEKTWLLASDKVYSVLAILLLIFGAVLTYLIIGERKVSQLEKRMGELVPPEQHL